MKLDSEAIDRLAAEYALGTLRGGAKRRFEALLQTDPDARRAVAAWQDRLHPLALMAAPVEPPESVWLDVASRTIAAERSAGSRASAPARSTPSSSGLRFWRWLGLSSSALAAVLLAVMLTGRMQVPSNDSIVPASFVAVLADKEARPVLVATVGSNQQLRLRLLESAPIPPDRSLELWAIPTGGKPKSLGLLTQTATQVRLPADLPPDQAPILAVSLEPAGGSKNPDGPSGPVLYSGKWLPV